jgi:hypothetical protein
MLICLAEKIKKLCGKSEYSTKDHFDAISIEAKRDLLQRLFDGEPNGHSS